MEGIVLTGAISTFVSRIFFILRAPSLVFRVCWLRNYKNVDVIGPGLISCDLVFFWCIFLESKSCYCSFSISLAYMRYALDINVSVFRILNNYCVITFNLGCQHSRNCRVGHIKLCLSLLIVSQTYYFLNLKKKTKLHKINFKF